MIESLKKYLDYKNGFFLEVGAFDGVNYSNTIHLEKQLNWKGLLIEPTFENYLSCIKNRPNSISCNCLLTSFNNYKKKSYSFGDFKKEKNGSGGPVASIFNFKIDKSLTHRLKDAYSKIRGKYSFIPVAQFPLSIITNYLDIKKIDFFSLDVEGYEYEVLNGINFNQLYIKYICIEIRNFHQENIFKFMEKKNFKLLEKLTNFGTYSDYLFVNNDQ